MCRQKANRVVSELQAGGFLIVTEQAVPGHKGFRPLARLAPTLDKAFLAAVPSPLSDPYNDDEASQHLDANGVKERNTIGSSVVANRDSVGSVSAVTFSDTVARDTITSTSGVTPSDNAEWPGGGVVPGRSAVMGQCSTETRHSHEVEMNDSHSSQNVDDDEADGLHSARRRFATAGAVALASAPAHMPDQTLSADPVHQLGHQELVAPLESWRVRDAERLTARHPRPVVVEAIERTLAKHLAGQVTKPGGYFRSVPDDLAKNARAAGEATLARVPQNPRGLEVARGVRMLRTGDGTQPRRTMFTSRGVLDIS